MAHYQDDAGSIPAPAISLRAALRILNAAALSIENPGRIFDEATVIYRDTDIQSARELLSRAIEEAEQLAAQLQTARTNVLLARAESRRVALASERATDRVNKALATARPENFVDEVNGHHIYRGADGTVNLWSPGVGFWGFDLSEESARAACLCVAPVGARG